MTTMIHPNHSNSCAEHREALFEIDCDDCQPNVAIDGDTVVVTRNHVYIQFLSIVKDELETVSTIGILIMLPGILHSLAI